MAESKSVYKRYKTFRFVLLVINLRNCTGLELVPFGVTFFCSLFVNMEYGILIGAGVHVFMLAYFGNRPHPDLIRLPVSQLKRFC